MKIKQLSPTQQFELLWAKYNKDILLIKEYRFHKKRRWKLDYSIPEKKIAIEVEGGAWGMSRHTSPVGFQKDCEKYNTAILMGWSVFRLPDLEITEERIVQIGEFINGGI
jgi:very-short-patch-repair endonuclease